MGIRRFSCNFCKIYSKTRVSELESSEKSSKLGRVNKRQARPSWFHAIEQANRSLSKASKSSMVCVSQASFASERAKRSLRKPA
ncbi:uncharacterized protein METZ01_LOCUS354019 [marine metagenome]|uniref:Uncharacterized protein n=1 Tax=marine metagenome TaxID=408172 RepID=A0A382RVG9_9ZZZZ